MKNSSIILAATGALARFWAANTFNDWHDTGFPFATLGVNVIGSFFMGLLYVLITERMHLHADLRYVLMIGFLGAFTTFSTFSIEAVVLLEQGYIGQAAAYVVGSVVLCLLACWSAVFLTRLI